MNEGESLAVSSLPQGKTLWKIFGVFFLLLLFIYSKSLNNEFVRWNDGVS